MKTFLIIIGIVVVVVGAYLLGQNNAAQQVSLLDDVALQEGTQNQNTEPTSEKEVGPAPGVENEQATLQYGQCPGFVVNTPTAGELVTFPLTITGTVHPASNPGPWIVFEGEAGSVRVQDTNGGVRSEIIPLSLNVPWMNSDPKPFSVTIPALTSIPYTNNVMLVFKDNNVAGPNEGQTHQCVLSITTS